jgi:methionyl-tRNA formyltransferase
MSLRIAFLGTGRLAQPVFATLCDSPHHVVGLVTQPERTGRGHHRHVNPLKELAEAKEIPVFQPEKIKAAESIDTLRNWRADLFVVAAYGQILPATILEMPRLGCINVHASLLPKYRGATPIHAAILNGDAETGVTIIRLVQKLDAGEMLGAVRTPIGARETTGELEARLADLAVPLTLKVIQELETGTVHPVTQDESQASHVGKLTKEDGWIPWEKSAVEVERHIRGMQPWPGPFTLLVQENRQLRMKILEVDASTEKPRVGAGVIAEVTSDSLRVTCGDGSVLVRRLQPDGKRAMTTAEFLRGHHVREGDIFDPRSEPSFD